ncbi:MAG: MOSC domain-containing protein [Alphaproteobacteria bacterium]|nr:MOSC domain-containing protein [Alphaproteobacteria bacterium]
MPILEQIHRFPVKGFSPDRLDRVKLLAGQALPHDRKWAIENGPGQFDDTAPGHVSKKNFLMLAGQQHVAAVKSRFDEVSGEVVLRFPDGAEFSLDPEDASTHQAAFANLEALLGPQVRGRLRLVQAPGQAMTDIPEPYLSVINLASVRDLGERAGALLDPVRMRGNLLIDGIEACSELDLIGKRLVFENLQLRVRSRITRCVATSINPETAIKDQDLPRTLFEAFGHMDCGVYVEVTEGGELRAGEHFDIID